MGDNLTEQALADLHKLEQRIKALEAIPVEDLYPPGTVVRFRTSEPSSAWQMILKRRDRWASPDIWGINSVGWESVRGFLANITNLETVEVATEWKEVRS